MKSEAIPDQNQRPARQQTRRSRQLRRSSRGGPRLVRLRDAQIGDLVPLEARPGAQLRVHAPELFEELSETQPIDLTTIRLALTASVLCQTLRRSGFQVRQVSTSDQQADIAVTSCSDEHAGQQTTRLRLVVGEVQCGGLPWPERSAHDPAQARSPVETVEGIPGKYPAGWCLDDMRYMALSAPYGACWNFSPPGLLAARCARQTLVQQLMDMGLRHPSPGKLSPQASALGDQFTAALAEDLNTPEALAILWKVVHSDLPLNERRALLLDFDQALELGLDHTASMAASELPAGARDLIDQRAVARRNKDWGRSDALRTQLAALGVEAHDTPEGSTYERCAQQG